MRQRAVPGILVALALLGVLWAAAAAVSTAIPGVDFWIYLLASLVVSIDLLDLGLRLLFRGLHSRGQASPQAAEVSIALDGESLTPSLKRLHLRGYGFIASIHDAESGIHEFLADMAPYRDRTWLIDDASSDDTLRRARQADFHCLAGGVNRKKPSAVRELLEILPPDIETVIVLDPDVRLLISPEELESVVFDFQRSGMAALCPRLSIAEDGLLGSLQGLEYHFAFDIGRRSLANFCVTSGVAMYRRSALARALERHSQSVYAEDLENTLILLAAGESIYFDGRLHLETEGPTTLKRWFSQRVGWSFGLAKVYTERFRLLGRGLGGRFMAFYQYVVYMGAFSLLLHPLKLVSLAIVALSFANGVEGLLGLDLVADSRWTHPAYFAAAYLEYLLLAGLGYMIAVPATDRHRLLPALPLYFFYVLVHLIPVSVGYVNWLSLRLLGWRIFQDHYQDEASLALAMRRGARG